LNKQVVLGPPFPYFGSKWNLSKHYPKPKHEWIIEPFAGSACYAMRHYHHKVWINDIDERVYDAWKFLIESDPEDILKIPIFKAGDNVSEIVQEIGDEFSALVPLLTSCGTRNQSKVTSFAAKRWSENVRKRLSLISSSIKHWKITNLSYQDIENIEATWFIDPPYKSMGKLYKHSCRDIDYNNLGEWSKERNGQVIVCEGDDHGNWLPFEEYSVNAVSYSNRKGYSKKSKEYIWTKDES